MENPVMLNKVLLQLFMHLLVLNARMGLKECLDPVGIMCWFYLITIGDVPEVLGHAALIFNDHVMQDDATLHYLPKHLRLPILSRSFDATASRMIVGSLQWPLY